MSTNIKMFAKLPQEWRLNPYKRVCDFIVTFILPEKMRLTHLLLFACVIDARNGRYDRVYDKYRALLQARLELVKCRWSHSITEAQSQAIWISVWIFRKINLFLIDWLTNKRERGATFYVLLHCVSGSGDMAWCWHIVKNHVCFSIFRSRISQKATG